MTKLLVSVRDAEEARMALDAGVGLIDVKEPRRGSLGAADPETVVAVANVVASRVPVSVALGELVDGRSRTPSPNQFAQFAGVAFAKWGLAGSARRADWRTLWRARLAELPPHVAPVAVVYADWQTASAPPPDKVLSAAVEFDCAAVLVDTFRKDRGSLLDHWDQSQVTNHVMRVQSRGMLAVVAGSITPAVLPQVLPCGPDLVAVRGAACSGSRRERIDAGRLGQLVALVHDRSTRRAL